MDDWQNSLERKIYAAIFWTVAIGGGIPLSFIFLSLVIGFVKTCPLISLYILVTSIIGAGIAFHSDIVRLYQYLKGKYNESRT